MKKLLIVLITNIHIILLLLTSMYAMAQSSYPFALETITFNADTKRVDKIPFDKPFRIEIGNLPTQGISSIFVYEMTYRNSMRCFKRKTADIQIPAKDILTKDQKISF